MTNLRYVLGIDFGAASTVVAKWVRDPSGQRDPEIVEIAGRPQTETALRLRGPSTIEEYGLRAWEDAAKLPDQTFADFKTAIGTGRYVLSVGGGGNAYPDDLAVLFLEKIREGVERHFNVGRLADVVDRTAIGCPVGWSPSRRDVLVRLVEKSGFPDPIPIDEPRGAVAYAQFRRGFVLKPGELGLVYDFGGGTTDVCLIQGGPGGGFDVLAGESVHDLGGRRVDELVCAEVQAGLPGFGLRTPADESEVRIKSRRLKERLVEELERGRSFAEETLRLSNQGARQIRLDRQRFLTICAEMIARFREPVDQALRNSGKTPGEIRSVILTGGSSRLPYVQPELAKLVPALRSSGSRLVRFPDPQEAPAKGLALACGAVLQGKIALTPRPAPSPTAPTVPAPPRVARRIVNPQRRRIQWLARHRWTALVLLPLLVGGLGYAYHRLKPGVEDWAARTATTAVKAKPDLSTLADFAAKLHDEAMAGKHRQFGRVAAELDKAVREAGDNAGDDFLDWAERLQDAAKRIQKSERDYQFLSRGLPANRRLAAPVKAQNTQEKADVLFQRSWTPDELEPALAMNQLRRCLYEMGRLTGKPPRGLSLHRVSIRVNWAAFGLIPMINAQGPGERPRLFGADDPIRAARASKTGYAILIDESGQAFKLSDPIAATAPANLPFNIKGLFQWPKATAHDLYLTGDRASLLFMEEDGGEQDDLMDSFQIDLQRRTDAQGDADSVPDAEFSGDLDSSFSLSLTVSEPYGASPP